MNMLDRLFGAPSREKFARLVMTGIRRAGDERKIHFDRNQFCLRPEGYDVSVMNLSNVYAEFCAADKAIRPKLLINVVRNWFADRRSLPDAFEDVHPDLLPTVRSRAYFEFALLQLKLEGAAAMDYPQQILADHLAIGLVYDLPDSMRTIVGQDLENWGVTFYEALETACANLRQKEDPVFVSPHDGVYLSATGDNYDASRLILADMVNQFDVRGEVIAMVPNRDTLIITGSENVPGLKTMAARARQALQEPRPISNVALRLADEEWSEWLPPVGHALYQEFATLRLQSLGQQHAEQKELLDAHYQKTGRDVLVATFSGAQNSQTGEIKSYCVWSEGVEALLPKTDLLYFFRPEEAEDDRSVIAATWEAVENTLAPLLEPQELYPPRYRVSSFPTGAQLQRLQGWANRS
ncbi:MAG: DUF1444 family protein [Pirellulales bacterium]